MKYIQLTQNKRAIIDDADFEYLNQWKWCIGARGYAVRKEKGKMVLMHRLVAKTPVGLQTDHINHDKLDNRRANLRSATHAENMSNRPLQSNSTTGYRGVYWHKGAGKWHTQITQQNKRIHIGYYSTIDEAKEAYERRAKQLFKEYACV